MKKCPFCAEEIKEKAIVCRYCGLDLENKISLSITQKRNLLALFRTIVRIIFLIESILIAILGWILLIGLIFGL